MYNRFENGIHPRDQVSDILAAAKDHSSSLEDHVRLLEKVRNIFLGLDARKPVYVALDEVIPKSSLLSYKDFLI